MGKLKQLLKAILRALIGTERMVMLKGFLGYCLLRLRTRPGKQVRLQVADNGLRLKAVLEAEGYHVYRGYYDLDYLDTDTNRFLCNRLPLHAGTNRDTTCEVGYYDLTDLTFHKLGDTHAWCWQQGCRLRWHPTLKGRAMYNDATPEGYCCRVVNADTGQCEQVIGRALYDLTPDARLGISVNFSRLQRLRPGYGYNYLDDDTQDLKAPDDDGIFLVDLATGQSRLLYSLKDLAAKIDPEGRCEHYINHVSIAPDGRHFMFFHIYVQTGALQWRTVLYASDIAGTALRMLEKDDNVSHYCWLDTHTLLETDYRIIPGGTSSYYCTYDIQSGQKTILTHRGLDTDGHPSRIPGTPIVITDTYPQVGNGNRQRIMRFDLAGNQATTLAHLYHDYRMVDEHRCDLHPSLADQGRIVSVDSTFQKRKRSIVLFEVNK